MQLTSVLPGATDNVHPRGEKRYPSASTAGSTIFIQMKAFSSHLFPYYLLRLELSLSYLTAIEITFYQIALYHV